MLTPARLLAVGVTLENTEKVHRATMPDPLRSGVSVLDPPS